MDFPSPYGFKKETKGRVGIRDPHLIRRAFVFMYFTIAGLILLNTINNILKWEAS